MIVLHAVTRDVPSDLDTEGLLRHDAQGLTVLHELSPERPEPIRDAVIEHGRRVTRLAERCSLLPMRYATVVETRAELDALVEEHAAAWAGRLDAVDGCCELIIHVDHRDEPPSAPRDVSGRDYLLGRVASQHRRTDLLRGAVTEMARWSSAVRTLPDERRIAALVPSSAVDEARRALSGWAADRPEVEVAVTGPWPPFSFCTPEAGR